MNSKSRILGILAATFLSLSMFGGVTAQTSDSEWTSAELTDPGGYICTIDIIGVDGSFGVWEFDGLQYGPTTGTTMAFLTDVYGGGMTGCNVGVYFDGLYGPGGWIDPSNFTAYSDYRDDFVDPWGFGDTVPSGVDGANVTFYDFQYTLDSVPSNLTPGLYEGGMNVYVSNAV